MLTGSGSSARHRKEPMKEQELFDSGTVERIRRSVAVVLDKALTEISRGVIDSVLDVLTLDLDDCPPHGINRPLTVNGQIVVTCHDCDLLITTNNGDLDDGDFLWRCYECLSID